MWVYKIEASDCIQNFKNINIIHVVAENENQAKEKLYNSYSHFVDDSFNATWETKVLTVKIISIKQVCYVDVI